MAKYLRKAAAAVATPPQSEPLNENQVPNSAGGYSFKVDIWQRLDRFLILGSEGGSYYASEMKLTKANIKGVEACVKMDPMRTVNRILEISRGGRAPKNDPALLALAYCSAHGTIESKSLAQGVMPDVARTGTMLFQYVDYVQQFRGWGDPLRRAVARWYTQKTPDKLADQVTKYQQRNGWTHRDVMRLSHPKFKTVEQQAIAKWSVKKILEPGVPARIIGHVALSGITDPFEAAKLIRQYELVRESVPTELLTNAVVWEALLEKMPMTAMIRNLGNMSKCGLLTTGTPAVGIVTKALGNIDVLKAARVHPIQILIAQRTYAAGHGLRGKGEWTPVPRIIDALDDAYYAAFDLVEPTGKRFYLGMDISGSMWGGDVAGIPNFSPGVASAAMAMVTIKREAEYYAAGFTAKAGSGWGARGSSAMSPLSFSPKQRLDDVSKIMNDMSERMGGTDCSLPMIDAMEKKMEIDAFVVYTDSETWAGDIHAAQALKNYRQKTGIPAKLIVVGMVANKFTIADPEDGGMMDVVGFDTAVPTLMADFIKQ